jgi:hypothetical protein
MVGFTEEELEDMTMCDELICSECQANEKCSDSHGLAVVVGRLSTQLLSAMDRVEQLEKELLSRELSPDGLAMMIRASTNEKARQDAERLITGGDDDATTT